jgi:DNA polymerase epsilon subunit 1
MKDGPDEALMRPVLNDRSHQLNPALELIKNLIAVLELDSDIETEVHILKRSLLAQVGVAEYAKAAQWVNPCPMFILPDIFCAECHESRDINLCYVSPRQVGEPSERHWGCEDCGTPYNVHVIEGRLLQLVHKKMVRYVLQDAQCTKTNRVASRALAPLSDCSAGLKLDLPREEAQEELRLLHNLAEFHELEILKETVAGMMSCYL